jgi:hypothetical protein
MVASFDAWAVEHNAIRRVLFQHLTFEDTAILECQVKYVSLRGLGHRIKPYDGHRLFESLQGITHAPQIPMTTV